MVIVDAVCIDVIITDCCCFCVVVLLFGLCFGGCCVFGYCYCG